MNWNSNASIAYKTKNEIVVNPLNIKILDNLNKKYVIVVGDEKLPNINKKILIHENFKNNIFNFL